MSIYKFKFLFRMINNKTNRFKSISLKNQKHRSTTFTSLPCSHRPFLIRSQTSFLQWSTSVTVGNIPCPPYPVDDFPIERHTSLLGHRKWTFTNFLTVHTTSQLLMIYLLVFPSSNSNTIHYRNVRRKAVSLSICNL